MITRIKEKICPTSITGVLLLCLLFMPTVESASAFDLNSDYVPNVKSNFFDNFNFISDTFAIGVAYTTHLFFHELGHQIVADEVDAESHRMNFFTSRSGKFYPGLSFYSSIPEESKLPYAVGGERMAGYTFEYALKSYRHNPTTFNKSLLLFSGVDFFVYTLLANYVYPDDDMYDPNLIREETGLSKGALLSIVAFKTLLNAYRIMDEDANFTPFVWTDKKSAGLAIRFYF